MHATSSTNQSILYMKGYRRFRGPGCLETEVNQRPPLDGIQSSPPIFLYKSRSSRYVVAHIARLVALSSECFDKSFQSV
jgi:hypothetical protein